MITQVTQRGYLLKIKVTLIMLTLSLSLLAYQDSSFSLFTPTALDKGEMEFSIIHRFYGPVDENVWDTLFGMNLGANVGLAFRRNIKYQIELKGSYSRYGKRYELGGSWLVPLSELPLALQLDVAYFSFEQPGLEERRRNFVYILSAQNKIYSERVVLSANLGFDGYYERLINGYALHLKYVESITFIGEYYPVWNRHSASTSLQQRIGKYDAYSFGFKIDTWGHHFKFSLGNGTQFHPATLSMGTDSSSELYFGFNIQRRF